MLSYQTHAVRITMKLEPEPEPESVNFSVDSSTGDSLYLLCVWIINYYHCVEYSKLSDFSPRNLSILRTVVKLHHASPFPCVNSLNFTNHFSLKGFEIRKLLPIGLNKFPTCYYNASHTLTNIHIFGHGKIHKVFLDKFAEVRLRCLYHVISLCNRAFTLFPL